MNTMNDTINFDELVELRQANVRGSKYHVKRLDEGIFNISNEGKAVIGHNPNMGVNIKYGNGNVLIGVLPKENKKCTNGLLNGTVGNKFTSNELEKALKQNNLIGETYNLRFVGEYQNVDYYAFEIKQENESAKNVESELSNQNEEVASETDPADEPVTINITAEDEF
jgi:hypothetical protein